MKNCTRLDIVTANLRQTSASDETNQAHPNFHWQQRKEKMTSTEWDATEVSLNKTAEQNGCSLDVSIVYEKKLKSFINTLKFNSPINSNGDPDKLSPHVISELRTLATLATDIADTLSIQLEHTNDVLPSESSEDSV